MRTLIKSGKIINADNTRISDILIEGEIIIDIRENIQCDNANFIDASGKLILPGGIDPHVHLDLPMFNTVSSDDYYTGGKAAAFGGTTTMIDFVPQDAEDLKSCVDIWHAKAENKASIDYSFHMNITKFNENIAQQIYKLPQSGITSLKVFTAYNDRLRLSDSEIFQVMRIAKDANLLTMVHSENGDIIELLVNEAINDGRTEPLNHAKTRPPWTAAEACFRAISFAAITEALLYIVHMNTMGEVDALNYGRNRGVKVMGETCPQYLFFTDEELKSPDAAKYICSPPLRSSTDCESLIRGIQDHFIQTIGTDHCPFFYNGSQSIIYEGKSVSIRGKELGFCDFTKIPNGLPGIGDRLPILWTNLVGKGLISPNDFVAITSTNPAKIFGLYPTKGAIEVGSDADLVLWDQDCKVHYGVNIAKHRTDYNLYEGWKLTGFPEKVFLRGNLIVDDKKWNGKPGMGRFIMRDPGEFI